MDGPIRSKLRIRLLPVEEKRRWFTRRKVRMVVDLIANNGEPLVVWFDREFESGDTLELSSFNYTPQEAPR